MVVIYVPDNLLQSFESELHQLALETPSKTWILNADDANDVIPEKVWTALPDHKLKLWMDDVFWPEEASTTHLLRNAADAVRRAYLQDSTKLPLSSPRGISNIRFSMSASGPPQQSVLYSDVNSPPDLDEPQSPRYEQLVDAADDASKSSPDVSRETSQEQNTATFGPYVLRLARVLPSEIADLTIPVRKATIRRHKDPDKSEARDKSLEKSRRQPSGKKAGARVPLDPVMFAYQMFRRLKRWVIPDDRTPPMNVAAVGKILVSHAQFIFLIGALSLKWPGAFRYLTEVLHVASGPGYAVANPNCVRDMDALERVRNMLIAVMMVTSPMQLRMAIYYLWRILDRADEWIFGKVREEDHGMRSF